MKCLLSESLRRKAILGAFVFAILFVLSGIVGNCALATYLQAWQFSWSRYEPPRAPAPSPSLVAEGRDLYAANCASCHGVSGEGNGWWSRFLYPLPRNFSRGIFRFKTTETGTLPTDQDLYRTVSVGLQGTAMPAWENWLSEHQRWAVVSYVKTFSPYFAEEAPGTPIELGTAPQVTAQQIERGRALFASAGCADCHGITGHGDGFAARDMVDSFGVAIRPRNLHVAEEFKRGRTMQDIALTVATGNDGSPMPAFRQALSNQQIWDLAAYVMSLDLERPTFRGRVCPMMAGPMR